MGLWIKYYNTVVALKPGEYTLGVNYNRWDPISRSTHFVNTNITLEVEAGNYYFINGGTVVRGNSFSAQGDLVEYGIGNLTNFQEVYVISPLNKYILIPSSSVIEGINVTIKKAFNL